MCALSYGYQKPYGKEVVSKKGPSSGRAAHINVVKTQTTAGYHETRGTRNLQSNLHKSGIAVKPVADTAHTSQNTSACGLCW